MIAPFYGIMPAAPTTGASNTFQFNPKHTVKISWTMEQPIFDWVRECCGGGFQLTAAGQHSIPTIKLVTDADYELFLLRWFDHVLT